MSSLSYIQAASAHDTRSDDKPMHRRFFIGPMPEKVLPQTEAKVRKNKKRVWFHRVGASPSDGEEDHDSLSGMIQEHAFQFFLSQGGNEEEWGDNEAESVQQEMLRRWRDSEWGSIWKRGMQKTNEPTNRWVGGSFEIGSFLGVNILDEAHAGSSRISASSKRLSPSVKPGPSTKASSSIRPSSPNRIQSAVPTSTAARDTIINHPSELSPSNFPKAAPLLATASAPGPDVLLSPENDHDTGSRRPISDSSTTPLLIPDLDQALPSNVQSDMLRRPFRSSTTLPARSDGNMNGSRSIRPALVPRKSKTVHYMNSPTEALPPAPPTEVLARTGSAVEETSAGATKAAATQDEIVWGDVVMRG
jgi:hypothetical protein